MVPTSKKHPQAGGALPPMPLSELPAMKALLARPPPAGEKANRKPVNKARQKT